MLVELISPCVCMVSYVVGRRLSSILARSIYVLYITTRDTLGGQTHNRGARIYRTTKNKQDVFVVFVVVVCVFEEERGRLLEAVVPPEGIRRVRTLEMLLLMLLLLVRRCCCGDGGGTPGNGDDDGHEEEVEGSEEREGESCCECCW